MIGTRPRGLQKGFASVGDDPTNFVSEHVNYLLRSLYSGLFVTIDVGTTDVEVSSRIIWFGGFKNTNGSSGIMQVM